jgi:hypothetical protein
MGTLIKATKLSFKLSAFIILALWLLMALGIDLVSFGFFTWTGYLALFLFIGYNAFLWYWPETDKKGVSEHA